MTPLRHRLAVLAAVAIGVGGLAAQDQLVLQALKKIESVEAGLKGLAPGDIPAANSLLADLKWAEKRLNAAYKKDTEDWKAAAKRLADADKAVRSQAAAKSAGSPAGANPEALSGAQQEKLQQLSKEVNNGQNNLRLLNSGDKWFKQRPGPPRTHLATIPGPAAAVNAPAEPRFHRAFRRSFRPHPRPLPARSISRSSSAVPAPTASLPLELQLPLPRR